MVEKILGQCIDKIFMGFKNDPRFIFGIIVYNWPSIVGESIASITVPKKINNKHTLVLKAPMSARLEISYQQMEIIDKINAHIGRKVIKNITFDFYC